MLATANGSRVVVPMLAAATRETYLGAVHASRRGAEVATAWSVSSHGTTQLAIERDAAALRTARHAWPDEIVGLTYFPHSDELWSSSGTHGARVAFSVHRSAL
ncbi:MAG TPA: hypothetical protein VFQ53_26400 [Kofleriaceae bacterium]|nr:hypothetical protein [Kofleriaceae bacterium]